MGLDLVPTSAAAFAAAALVQTVRERRRSSRDSLGCFETDAGEDLDGVSGRGLSLRDRQRIGLRENAAAAKEELSRAWLYQGDTRDEVTDYFNQLNDPNWKLCSARNGLEVWRLPGEKIHRIMGVATVNVPPEVCMQYFKDPKKVFGQLFPRIDLMFTGGQVISVPSKDRAVCHATFKMPMPVGNAPAHGIRSRDFVWDQHVTKLNTGNVLVTAIGSDKYNVPLQRGIVRGNILTSGYYGRKLPGKDASKVWYIIQADPKGFLPKWLVNLASTRQASNLTRLADMFRNGKPQF